MAQAPDSIVIVSAARTPIGGMLGDFSALAAHQLGSVAIKAAVERAGVTGDAIDEVLMGNCLMAGQGQAPARQAALGAGLPQSAGAVTLSKMCGSGMRAMMFAHDMLKSESAEILVAGGMESMTNAPHLTFVRKGIRYGASQLLDHMAIDGLEDAYEKGRAMGVFAEECVDKYKFTREAMDRFAISSTERAKKANEDGSFDWEMAPVKRARQGRRDDREVRRAAVQGQARQDPGPQAGVQERRHDHRRDLVEHLRRRRRAGADARVDGDAPGLQADRAHRRALGARAGAELVHDGAGRRDREGAEEGGWAAKDVDLWEVNEAFAAVTMAAMTEFKLAHEIVNVHGGAVALGHPIGASGARIVVTLLGALRSRRRRRRASRRCASAVAKRRRWPSRCSDRLKAARRCSARTISRCSR